MMIIIITLKKIKANIHLLSPSVLSQLILTTTLLLSVLYNPGHLGTICTLLCIHELMFWKKKKNALAG